MLYLSNPSRQHVTFCFRTTQPKSVPDQVTIRSGQQVEIGHKWSAEDRSMVIEQLRRSGARDAAEAHGHMDRFQGLLYRDAAPVDEGEIMMAHDAVVATQEARTAAQTTRAALGFDRTANRGIQRGGKRLARVTEVEVAEHVDPRDRSNKKDPVHFQMAVDPEGRTDVKAVQDALG